MIIRIEPYTSQWIGSVIEFNRRVAAAKVPFAVPETPIPSWLPKVDGRTIYQEVFLAVEGRAVRGAYTFKHQEFFVGGRLVELGMCRMPISEGIVDRQYSL